MSKDFCSTGTVTILAATFSRTNYCSLP